MFLQNALKLTQYPSDSKYGENLQVLFAEMWPQRLQFSFPNDYLYFIFSSLTIRQPSLKV